MENRDQTLNEVIESLSPLEVDWMDDTAANAIAKLTKVEIKDTYDRDDLESLLADNFEEGILCARLFLGLSKDTMKNELNNELGPGGIGVKRYKSAPDKFFDALVSLGLPEKMAAAVNFQPVWSDILLERLRSGRGSAISGQKRGRGLEDFTEALVKEVFGDQYETRCNFTGADGNTAKCDVAIPDKTRPRIIIEVKGYGATGSKMTDIIGDLDAIISAKRHDSYLFFVTDGTAWTARLSDLRKIVDRQNQGKVARIYTMNMREDFLSDLRSLKAITGL